MLATTDGSDLGRLADPADIGHCAVIRAQPVQRIARIAPAYLAAQHPVALGSRRTLQRSESKLFTEVGRRRTQQCNVGHEGSHTTDRIDVGIDQLEIRNPCADHAGVHARPEELAVDQGIDCVDEFTTEQSELALRCVDIRQRYVGQRPVVSSARSSSDGDIHRATPVVERGCDHRALEFEPAVFGPSVRIDVCSAMSQNRPTLVGRDELFGQPTVESGVEEMKTRNDTNSVDVGRHDRTAHRAVSRILLPEIDDLAQRILRRGEWFLGIPEHPERQHDPVVPADVDTETLSTARVLQIPSRRSWCPRASRMF